MSKLLHINLIRKPGITDEQIQKQMNLAVDWFKYSSTSWLIWTTSDIAKWKLRLDPLFRPKGIVFICEIDPNNCDGFMNPEGWKWLRKHGRKLNE